jgi:hypothetical protein
VNVAVIVVFAFSVTTHCENGVSGRQALDGAQPTNCAPELGVAVRKTEEPGTNEVPVGDCMIAPGPTTTVVSVTFAAKFAVAVVFAFKINVHVVWEVLGQTPPQFTNVAFAFGVAVSVIVVLFANDVPVGVWATVPGPLAVTAKVNLVTVVAPLPVSELLSVSPFGPLIVTAPARPPTACGENVSVMEHDEPAGIGAAVQVFVCEKSPGFEPPMAIDVTTSDSVAFGPFCSWTVRGEEEPRAVSGNKIGTGATRIGSGAGGGGVLRPHRDRFGSHGLQSENAA